MDELLVIGITLLAAVIAAIAQYVFKKSVPKFNVRLDHIKSLFLNKGLWIGALLYIASLAVYLVALRSGDLSFVYPTFASTFIFIALISHFALKEKMGNTRILGLILVFIGILFVALSY